jgi:hypothetical protein
MYSIIRYCIILSLIIFFVEKGFSQLTPIDWEKIHALFEDDKKEKDPCKIGISPLSTIPRLSTTLELGFITFFDQEAFSAIREFRNVSNDSIPPFTANIGVSYRYSNRWLLEANVGFISDNTFPKAVMSSSGKIHFLMKSKKKEKTFNTVFWGEDIPSIQKSKNIYQKPEDQRLLSVGQCLGILVNLIRLNLILVWN